MTTKEKLLKVLDTELSMIIENYTKNEEELVISNKKLKQRISKLEKENEELQRNLELISFRDSMNYFLNRLDKGISNELIDNLVLSSSIHDAVLLFSIAEKLWVEDDFEILLYIFELLKHNPTALKHSDVRVQESIVFLTKVILLKDSSQNEPIADEIIHYLLDMLIDHAEFTKQDLHSFIKDEEKIFENILYLNNPLILSKYFRLLFMYGLIDQLKASLVHILDVEWGFLDSSLTKSDFTFLLWYCYLFDYDEDLIKKASVCLQWFTPKNKDISLYFYVEKNEEKVNRTELHLLIEQFRNCKVLNEVEKAKVLSKVEMAIEDRQEHYKKLRVSYDPVIIIKEESNDLFIERKALVKRPVILPLYKGKHEKTVYGFHETTLYVDPSRNEVILEEDELRKILYKDKLIPNLKENQTYSFKWPTTEVSEQKAQADNSKEEKVLNEKSALMELGYKVSGNITRSKRGEILQQAVPKLGLQKVAYIISYNIKMRKRQTNGAERFANAIAEWEYDLDKLKSSYYKYEFNWPSN